jgi:hypothetical protein
MGCLQLVARASRKVLYNEVHFALVEVERLYF